MIDAPLTLYFAPLACSLAVRIAFYEAGVQARYIQVDTRAGRLIDGSDYSAINPMGQAPALRTESGEILTEGAAILQYVADAVRPHADLAPTSGLPRSRLQQWLGFIATELHKAVFAPLLDPTAPDSVKAYAREKIPRRFAVLQERLAGHEHLLESFSVADAYLVAILNWTTATRTDLSPWPAVAAYHQRMLKRTAIARAAGEELALYREEQARVHRA
jgi:glutathione S-transferase